MMEAQIQELEDGDAGTALTQASCGYISGSPLGEDSTSASSSTTGGSGVEVDAATTAARDIAALRCLLMSHQDTHTHHPLAATSEGPRSWRASSNPRSWHHHSQGHAPDDTGSRSNSQAGHRTVGIPLPADDMRGGAAGYIQKMCPLNHAVQGGAAQLGGAINMSAQKNENHDLIDVLDAGVRVGAGGDCAAKEAALGTNSRHSRSSRGGGGRSVGDHESAAGSGLLSRGDCKSCLLSFVSSPALSILIRGRPTVCCPGLA